MKALFYLFAGTVWMLFLLCGIAWAEGNDLSTFTRGDWIALALCSIMLGSPAGIALLASDEEAKKP